MVHNQELQEQLNWLKRQLFGQKSERIVEPPQGEQLLPGMEPQELPKVVSQPVAAHQRRKRVANGQDAMRFPDDLPVFEEIIDLPEEQKVCPVTGRPFVLIGEEVTDRLGHSPASYFIRRIIRLKYGLPDGDGVRTAELPEGLLERCTADESFLAELVVQKFADHLPIYRIDEILERQGIEITQQNLGNWIHRSGMALEPLYQALVQAVLECSDLYMDETTVDQLAPGKGKTHTSYMWVTCGAVSDHRALVAFHYAEGRQHKIAEALLKGYSGRLHSDKYGAYETLAQKKVFVWCPCWAHIRRKFFEAESGDPEFRKEILEIIRQLYELERIGWEGSSEERLCIRQEKSAPLIDTLINKVKQRLVEGKLLPKSKLREALGYVMGLVPHLKNYCHSAEGRIDNNTAERAIRPLAIGRKNWLFIGSPSAGKSAAILFSLVQSCRSCGVNPRVYLEDVMRRLQSFPASRIAELLPHRWSQSKD